MKKRIVSILLIATMVTALFVGCGKNENKKREPYVPTVTNLDEIKIGPFNWPVHQGYDYSKPYNKRFDGLEFTYCANGTGTELEAPYSPEENPETWRLQGVTGLKARVEWMAAGVGYTQKMSQAITMGDIPDVMTVSMKQYVELVKSGLIADLTEELTEEEHPTLQERWETMNNMPIEALRIDGRIYGIPNVNADYDGNPYVWVRKDWLEKLNIEAPKSWKDLERVAKAFIEQDPDGNGKKDTYGLPITSEYGNRSDGSVSELFLNVGGANLGRWMKQEDGSLIFGSVHEGAKEALTLLNDWYKKGIIPDDFALWDSGTIGQIVADNQCGIILSPWFAGSYTLSDSIALNPDAEWEAFLLPGEEGQPVYANRGDSVAAITVVSKDFPHPEAIVYAMDMLEANGNKYNTEAPDPDFAYGSCEGYIEVSGGYKPVGGPVPGDYYTGPVQAVYNNVEQLSDLASYESAEAANADLTEKVKETDRGHLSRMKSTTFVNMPIILAELKGQNPRQVKIKNKYGEELDLVSSYRTYLTYWQGPEAVVKAQPIGVMDEYLGTSEKLTLYGNYLGSYYTEEFTNMIMGKTGGKSISKYFDNYVKQYNKQGGTEVNKEVNELYKEMKKNLLNQD